MQLAVLCVEMLAQWETCESLKIVYLALAWWLPGCLLHYLKGVLHLLNRELVIPL